MVANRPVTPRDEGEASGNAQNPSPVKEKVRTLTQFWRQKDLGVSQQDIFKFCHVPPRTGYRYIADAAAVFYILLPFHQYFISQEYINLIVLL
ncbi:uncharacterized protein PV07_12821 [Cladophialophora immunda]|uniref:Uncharacterized protein n=1 Tax=Cladophialophora immunda TaxID=569365 RepID=A0A0D2BRP1_9EURO|nr:uncharacterized protein PV07_12821 [Cladophialophora immunda]KIW21748.1 hypothetical protein PV07_12821 [Cladophialophora immunda]